MYFTNFEVSMLFQNEDGYFVLPYDAELECKQNIVVYDSNTSTVREADGKLAIFYSTELRLNKTYIMR